MEYSTFGNSVFILGLTLQLLVYIAEISINFKFKN